MGTELHVESVTEDIDQKSPSQQLDDRGVFGL